MFVEKDTQMEKLEMDKDIPYLSTKSLFGGVAKEFCQLFKYALCMSALIIHSNLFKNGS